MGGIEQAVDGDDPTFDWANGTVSHAAIFNFPFDLRWVQHSTAPNDLNER